MEALRLSIYDSRKSERGFTLPEVLITIVLLGLLFAIASSTWQSVVESRRVDSATNQVLSDLRLSHTRATNQLTEYRVAYVSGGNINCAGLSATDPDPTRRPNYCLLRKNADGSWGQTARFLPERTMISGDGLNVDTTIAALLGSPDARTVKFDANGGADSGGGLVSGSDIRVTVASDDGVPSNVLDVNPATSRIEFD